MPPLQAPKWYPNERIDDVDLNRGGTDALANLALLAQYGSTPITVTANPNQPSMIVTLSAGSLLTPTGALIIADVLSTLALAPNGDGSQDRIALIEITPVQADGQNEQRYNELADDTVVQVATNTRTIGNQVVGGALQGVQVVLGALGSPPTAPNTDAGYVPLAYVLLRHGLTPPTILSSDITLAPAGDALWYPRVYAGHAPLIAPLTLPLTVPVFSLPAIPAGVVGIGHLSCTLRIGAGLVPFEVTTALVASLTAVPIARGAVLWALYAEGAQTFQLAARGMIFPASPADTYSLSVTRSPLLAGPNSYVTISDLVAMVEFHRTIAPWPGLV